MSQAPTVTETVITGTPPPPAKKDRIRLLDAARGLGVLGILPCNMPDFAYPLSIGESIKAWPHGTGWETLTAWGVTQVFFQKRFITLFAMLFGISIFLVGGERADKERGLILRKRLFVLLAVGLVHCFLVWWGDVLVSYALCGFIMLWMRSFTPRRLLLIGGGIWIGLAALSALGAVMSLHPRAPHSDAVKQMAEGAKSIAAYSNGFWGSLVANARDGLKAQMGQPFIILITLPLMCMGLAAYKLGVFTGEASRATYRTLIVGGLAALFVVAIGIGAYAVSGLDRAALVTGMWAQSVLAPIMSLAYLALLFYALRSRIWRHVTDSLAPVGQMAFTNYLTQSLLMTALFYGGRGPGLYGKVDRPGLWAICIGVWMLQIVWSRLWLTYCTMGPFEWCWRRLYRGPAPLRRSRPGPPDLTLQPSL